MAVAEEKGMITGPRHRWFRAFLAASVAVLVAAGAACRSGDRAVPMASPVATPASQERTRSAPESGRAGSGDIAATYLVSALRPVLSGGSMGGLPAQAWEPVAPGQAERLMVLLPEQVPGLMRVFEGSFRAQDQGSETLVAVRVFARMFTENPADWGAVVFTVATQPQGSEAQTLQEWQGYGLPPEGLAALTQIGRASCRERV